MKMATTAPANQLCFKASEMPRLLRDLVGSTIQFLYSTDFMICSCRDSFTAHERRLHAQLRCNRSRRRLVGMAF